MKFKDYYNCTTGRCPFKNGRFFIRRNHKREKVFLPQKILVGFHMKFSFSFLFHLSSLPQYLRGSKFFNLIFWRERISAPNGKLSLKPAERPFLLNENLRNEWQRKYVKISAVSQLLITMYTYNEPIVMSVLKKVFEDRNCSILRGVAVSQATETKKGSIKRERPIEKRLADAAVAHYDMTLNLNTEQRIMGNNGVRHPWKK